MAVNQPKIDGSMNDFSSRPRPASPSVRINCSSKKRLLSDSEPKHVLVAGSPDPSLSSNSSSDLPRKKTRELPNFSDCHGCGVRFNYTDPKDRLHNLDSVWRVVLLCRRCMKRVESGRTCPYCFADAAESDCFRCQHCERQIHKDCVLKNRNFAPWSYCDSEFDFSVCVDCWVPRLLANSIRVRRRDKKVISKSCPPENSKVSADSNGSMSLEDVVKDATTAVEKKAVAAEKAKANALRKAVIAKRAMELARNALHLVEKKDKVGAKGPCSLTNCSCTDTSETIFVDDAELAFRLHRAMNSSPRKIPKNSCSINLSCFDVPKTWSCNRNVSSKLADSRGACSTDDGRQLEAYSNSKSVGSLDRTVSETSVCIRALGGGSGIELGSSKPDVKTYTRTKLRSRKAQENGESNLIISLAEKCNLVGSSSVKQDFLNPELHIRDADSDRTVQQNRSPDRYMLKYRKRQRLPVWQKDH